LSVILGSKVDDGPSMGERRLLLARKRPGLTEVRPKDFDLVDEGRFVDRATGKLYMRVQHDVFGLHSRVVIDDRSYLWFEAADGWPLFLQPAVAPAPTTLVELRAGEAEYVAGGDAHVRAAPKRTVTLSEVTGRRDLPTPAGAARFLESVYGTVEAVGGRLRVMVPSSFSNPGSVARGSEEDAFSRQAARATQVLIACRELVLAALAEMAADRSKSPKPLSERLPDRELGADGTVG
jgi:hypothetical protein